MRLPFTSEAAKKISAHINEAVYFHALQASMRLADQHGPFSEFRNSRYADGKLQPQLARDAEQGRMPEFHYDWDSVAREVQKRGLRNSLLIAIAPTATIASIVGSYESIEPQISNIFKRETLSGEFLQVNRYLIKDLQAVGLWTPEIREKIVHAEGSIQAIEEIPLALRELYKTTWEISQKELIDMAVDRSTFICQSQSLNLFLEAPTVGKLSSMYMYAWKQGVKTTYYLRSRAAKITNLSGFQDALTIGDFDGLLESLLDGGVTMGDKMAGEYMRDTLEGAGLTSARLAGLSSSDNPQDRLIARTAGTSATAMGMAQLSYEEAAQSLVLKALERLIGEALDQQRLGLGTRKSARHQIEHILCTH
jgi:hypothetical protein